MSASGLEPTDNSSTFALNGLALVALTEATKKHDTLLRLKEVINDLHEQRGDARLIWTLTKIYDELRLIR